MSLTGLRHAVLPLLLLVSTGATAKNKSKSMDWLKTNGSEIVDLDGNPVWITGINWFGYNTGTNALDGLWSVSMKDSLKAIANRGFNMLRLPISTELLHKWSKGERPAPNVNTWVNKELEGLNSLEIFDQLLKESAAVGLKVMIDVHSADTNAMGHFDPLWYSSSISTEVFYDAWVWLADRYKDNDTILAFDLENEPHGKYYQDPDKSAIWDDSDSQNNWRQVAETLSNKILAVHPHILILVEGIETTPKEGEVYESRDEEKYYNNWWGGNLRRVKDFPVVPQIANQLVYSPHDYGPSVFRQPWFYEGFNKETLFNDVWKVNWFYIKSEGIAPLLIGEWGGFLDGGDNEKWQTALRDFIIEEKIHHTYWCFNANSGDTGGLVLDDFKTWDEQKYAFVEKALWKNGEGKFIGLDKEIPLGDNGLTKGGR